MIQENVTSLKYRLYCVLQTQEVEDRQCEVN